MTRTIDEIKLEWQNKRAKWEEAQPQHSLDEAMEWLGSYGVVWKLLDHIATLEAQVQVVGEWESVENPPPFICAEQSLSYGEVDWIDIPEGGELPMGEDMEYFSKPVLLQLEAIGNFYGYNDGGVVKTSFEIDDESIHIKGWKHLKEQDEK